MPELDSIRGIAILGVLFYHGFFWGIDLAPFSKAARLVLTGMWVGRLGVDLFFVLSGFLITGLLLDSKERPQIPQWIKPLAGRDGINTTKPKGGPWDR